MRLYDTLRREVAPLRPATPGLLRIYACGPTVYRPAHVGNLRTFLLADLVSRVAQHHGLRVHLVQNITDVGHLLDDEAIDASGEDKLLAAGRQERRHPLDVARHYEAAFHADLAALNIRPAEAYPRASESVALMQDLIAKLISSGHAYQGSDGSRSDGSVYFDARSFPGYGALSGNRLSELRPGHGASGESTAVGKRFHADWALWKVVSGERELVWDSPWGRGFPGWHVECSAMSLRELGETIDVHTGGIDLRFPHHEDERAQSEAAVAHPVVRHWVHGEHLLFAGRKMAKSSANVVLLADVVDRGLDPLALRLAFLQTRYRQQVTLGWETLDAADALLRRWRTRVAQWAESPSGPVATAYADRVRAGFDDDLDTPTALVALRQLEHDATVAPGAKFETFADADRLLGLDLARDVGRPPPPPAPLPPAARDLLERRTAARAARDWPMADRLRAELAALGIQVVDTASGQSW